MFASLIFGAPKAGATRQAAGAVKSASKATAKPKVTVEKPAVRKPTEKQAAKAEAKRKREYAENLLARVPDKPVPSGFHIFQQENKSLYSGANFEEYAKLASKAWAALSDAEKKPYGERVAVMKDEYNTALKAFKKTLTPHRQKVLAEHGIELPRVKSAKPQTLNEYSQFVKSYCAEHKQPDLTGKEAQAAQTQLFKDAAAAWKAQK